MVFQIETAIKDIPKITNGAEKKWFISYIPFLFSLLFDFFYFTDVAQTELFILFFKI